MSLTAKDVAEIMRLLEDSTFDQLDLEVGDLKLSLRRGDAPSVSAPRAVPTPPTGEDQLSKILPRATGEGDREAVEGAQDIPSPLLGVFYRAPKPGEAPFVEVGAQVEEDTVIAIIEVMKLMNSVHAGVKGEVVEVLAQNGALVEFGQPLMRVRKA